MNKTCINCIRRCGIEESFCGRKYIGNEFVHISAQVIDSIFDKPILHFSENIKTLSIGSWGCNFRCLGCQNSYLSWSTEVGEVYSKKYHADELIDTALQNGCKGVCYTFNEPAVILDEVEEVSIRVKEHGLFNFLITNSTLTIDSTKRIAPLIDAVATDIKSMDEKFYYNYCGAKGINDVVNKILACIKTFYDEGTHVEVRTNIIPGANDNEEILHSIARWIKDNLDESVPWHLTRFFPAHKLSHLPKTSTASLLNAQKIGIAEGLKHVHVYFSKSCDCAKEEFLLSDNKIGKHSCCR